MWLLTVPTLTLEPGVRLILRLNKMAILNDFLIHYIRYLEVLDEDKRMLNHQIWRDEGKGYSSQSSWTMLFHLSIYGRSPCWRTESGDTAQLILPSGCTQPQPDRFGCHFQQEFKRGRLETQTEGLNYNDNGPHSYTAANGEAGCRRLLKRKRPVFSHFWLFSEEPAIQVTHLLSVWLYIQMKAGLTL